MYERNKWELAKKDLHWKGVWSINRVGIEKCTPSDILININTPKTKS